jgi:hypothetical protein
MSGGKISDELLVPAGSDAAAPFVRIARICERDIMMVRQYYTRAPFLSSGSNVLSPGRERPGAKCAFPEAGLSR